MIRTEILDDVCVLRMERGHANALSPGFLSALHREIDEIRRGDPSGLVITGQGNVFCAGLDLKELLELDREGIRGVLHLLYAVCRGLFAFPRPVVAALNGHAIAGGAIVALACDLRFMQQGEAKFGLSEIALGLSVPPSLVEMARYSLDRPILEKLLYGGTIYPAFKALDMGVLDELIDGGQLLGDSVEAVRRWSSSPTAFADIKGRLKATALDAMASAHLEDAAWLDLWFEPATRKRLIAARDALLGGREDIS